MIPDAFTGRVLRAIAIALVAISAIVHVACGHANEPRASSIPPQPPAKFGVLVMAHGGPPEWNAAVEEAVTPLRDKYEIEVAFGMADATSLQEATRKLEARNVRRIGVVRLFVSGESWLERTQQIFGLRAGAPSTPAHPSHSAHAEHAGHAMAFFRVASHARFELSREGLADASSMGHVLADRATALSTDPTREDVLVLAHGPGDDGENARWLAKLEERAQAIRAAAPFRRVEVETLREDWPDKRAAAEQNIRAFVARASANGGKAIVLPFRVQGFGPYAKVLADLDYVSDGKGLIPHPEVGAWIERQIVELAARPFDERDQR